MVASYIRLLHRTKRYRRGDRFARDRMERLTENLGQSLPAQTEIDAVDFAADINTNRSDSFGIRNTGEIHRRIRRPRRFVGIARGT